MKTSAASEAGSDAALMTEHNPELALVSDFLAECLPFDSLDDPQRLSLAAQIEVGYFRRGHRFSASDGEGLQLLRSGAVDELGEEGVSQRLEAGESFQLTSTDPQRFTAFEDTLIYQLPGAAFEQLCQRHRHIDRFFRSRSERQLRRAARYRVQEDYFQRSVSSLMSAPVLSVSPRGSIAEAARLMTVRRVSCVLVLDERTELLGIVTDRDLRSRVLAAGLSSEASISEIMSAEPVTVAESCSLFDAVLLMADHRVHHLPVLADSGEVAGLVSTSDLHLAREDDPLFFIRRLSRAGDVQSLAQLMQRLPEMFRQWVVADTQSHQIARLTTAISDAVTRRLIVLAEAELGPAPVAYCWLGFGSQARGEQLLGGDQDNGLLIDDSVSEAQLPWFAALAKRVCDGLNDCGYVYCPGEVMASNEQWRKPLAAWRKTVDSWLRNPTPAAVMRVSIFFDLRAIHGDSQLCAQLQKHMLKQTQGNSIFLAALADNVLGSSPPTGLFGRLLVERSGEHSRELDLKKRGILPIVDMTRLHALAAGVDEVNTYRRLQALAKAGAISLVDSRNMEDAYTLINSIRLKQQARQLAEARPPSHFLNPDSLSRLQRQHLKQAFGIVRQAQESLRLNYRAGL